MFPSRSSPFPPSNSLLPALFFGGNDPFFGAMSIFPQHDLLSEFFNMGFGSGMMRPMFSENLSDLMGFSGENLNNMAPNNSDGNCYVRTQTFFQSNYLDENGQPQREKYTSHQEFGVNDKNEKIFEKKEGYKHSGKRIERLAHEQMLDNEGRKIVREKGPDGNEQNATHYFNMNEDRNQEFENKFKTVKSTFSNTPAAQAHLNRDFNAPLSIAAEGTNANYFESIPLGNEALRNHSTPSRPIERENYISRNEPTFARRYQSVQSNISPGLNYSSNNFIPSSIRAEGTAMIPEVRRAYQSHPSNVNYSRLPDQPINPYQQSYINQNPNIIRYQTINAPPARNGIQRGNYYYPPSYY